MTGLNILLSSFRSVRMSCRNYLQKWKEKGVKDVDLPLQYVLLGAMCVCVV